MKSSRIDTQKPEMNNYLTVNYTANSKHETFFHEDSFFKIQRLFDVCVYKTLNSNSMAYGTQRFNAPFTRALQKSLS